MTLRGIWRVWRGKRLNSKMIKKNDYLVKLGIIKNILDFNCEKKDLDNI